MLIDNKMLFMEAKVFTTGESSGTIDLYGEDIAVYPNSNNRKKHGRGTGTALVLHAVVTPGGTGIVDFGGTLSVVLKIGDTVPATVVVQTTVVAATLQDENKGMHVVAIVPYDVEGRYATCEVSIDSLTGMGSAPVCTAWLFAQ